MITRIVSSENTRLKTARNLLTRSGIQKHGLFLMEGPRFVSDYLQRDNPEWIFISEDASAMSAAVAESSIGKGIDVLELPRKLYRNISDTESSQGITAICSVPDANISDLSREGIFLLLDRISDPGNMGTIIRSAAAFGCTAVVGGKGCCCPFTPKVTRAAAGLNTVVPLIFDSDLASFMQENTDNVEYFGADASGMLIDQITGTESGIGLVIGSEAHGISDEIRIHLKASIAIPMIEGIESLNAAVSASILLYHFGALRIGKK